MAQNKSFKDENCELLIHSSVSLTAARRRIAPISQPQPPMTLHELCQEALRLKLDLDGRKTYWYVDEVKRDQRALNRVLEELEQFDPKVKPDETAGSATSVASDSVSTGVCDA